MSLYPQDPEIQITEVRSELGHGVQVLTEGTKVISKIREGGGKLSQGGKKSASTSAGVAKKIRTSGQWCFLNPEAVGCALRLIWRVTVLEVKMEGRRGLRVLLSQTGEAPQVSRSQEMVKNASFKKPWSSEYQLQFIWVKNYK